MPKKSPRRGPGRPPKNNTPTPSRVKLGRELLVRIAILDRYFRDLFDNPDPNVPYLSIAELVPVVRIARSTLVKDLKTLRETFNAPVKFIKERGGWGYTEKAAYLPNILISEGDLTILCSSWSALQRRGDAAWAERVRPVMERLMTALHTDISFDFEAVAERIIFRGSGYHEGIDLKVFETVVSAVLGQQEVAFTYRKRMLDGSAPAPERRHVQPRVLVCIDRAWYVVTNDPERDGKQRTFALFRMSEAENTRIAFTPQGHIDLDEVLKHSLGIDTSGDKGHVELRFKPEVAGLAQEEFWHDTQEFTAEADGSVLLEMDVVMNPELERRIQKFGSKVNVLGPQVLREKFIGYAREQQEMYLQG